MRLALYGACTLLCSLALPLTAQDAGDAPRDPATDPRVLLRYAAFDPLVAPPQVPAELRAGADTHLWIVQFQRSPSDRDRQPILAAGARIHGWLPHDCHIVRMDSGLAQTVRTMPAVRWVGAYEPAYRLEAFLLTEQATGNAIPTRRYNMVMADKRGEKQALEAKIVALGGTVFDRHHGGLLFTADLTGPQLLAAARLDEVLWIDRWSAPEQDMDNARIQGGANHVETNANYTGSGIRGHVYEGVEYNHSDFNTNLTAVRSTNTADDHGHCTAGIVFGNGTSAAQARGMAPNAVGFFTDYGGVQAGWSRNMVIGDVVNVHNCMFTTASWGSAQTTQYTADSADADDIVFDHRIPWTNSMSNLGNQNARPQAWAKNVISIGGVVHGNNSTAGDDSWLAGNGSIGPAQDGRNKPDLASYYELVWTSDRTGALGYTAGNSFTGFSGTSSATPIVAGHNALAIQMFTDHIFSNAPRVVGGTRFQNRPYAQTLKALMIASAEPYTATATDNRREHVGWGHPDLQNLYDRRNRYTIIPEDVPIQQGQTHTYSVNVLSGETRLKVCMTYLDPAGVPAAAIDRINDLTLRVIHPNGTTAYWGNVGLVGAAQDNTSATGGAANTLDTVECVFVNSPAAGTWTIQVTAPTIAQDAHVATGATDATYALVVNGGTRLLNSGCARYIPDTSTTSDSQNFFPFGGNAPTNLATTLVSNNGLSGEATVFFDLTVSSTIWVTQLQVGCGAVAGTIVKGDIWRTNAGVSHVGNETNPVWLPQTAARGVAAGPGVSTTFEFAEPFLLTPGVYGFAVTYEDPDYTNGTGTNENYSNADVAISCGSSKAGTPGTAGTVFSPRVFNGTFQYRVQGAQGTNIRYQTIVRRDELGLAGTIRGLQFSFGGTGTGRHWNDSLLIRMAHVPAGYALVSTFATNIPSAVTVLNATNYSWGIDEDSWREIGLQTPFAYNGTSDLVIDIVARGNWQTVSGGFHDSNEPRVYNAIWSGLTPTTGTVDNDQSLRMRVSFNCASANEHGSTCGRMRASHSGIGVRGTTFHYRLLDGPPNLFAVISLGLSNSAPLPISLNAFGWTNCIGWNDPVTLPTVATDGSGVGDYPLAIPNNAALDGAYVFGQWFTFDTSEPGSLTFSNHTRMQVGLNP